MAIAIGLLKMLLELQQTRKTGALDVTGPGARVRLFIDGGSVVAADEGTLGETLGRILVRERVLTQEQYAAAIESMTELRAAGKPAKLGEVFVQLGLLTQEQVHAALDAQVKQKVMRALGWPSAAFRFVESRGPINVPDRFETAIEPLAVAALKLADRERIDELLSQARDRYAALRGDRVPGGGSTKLETIARINAFRLPSAEDAFARSLDGSRTIRELTAEGDTSGNIDRGVIIAALLLTDALDLHRTPSAARPIGVPRPPSRKVAAAPSAPRAPTAAKASEPRVPGADPRPSEPLVASEPQGPTKPRASGEPPMAPLLAERAFQAGKKLARAHRLADAVVELRRAASMYPAVEYDLWAAWAEARSDARGEDSHEDKLRKVAELAIEQDTERGFATYVLGHLARRAGDNARADELFARARAIDPEVTSIDAWSVRLRLDPPSATTPNTRSDVVALAPLMTRPSTPPPPKEADANANANANAEADADANANADAKADADADVDSDAGAAVKTEANADVDREPPEQDEQEVAAAAESAPPIAPAPARAASPAHARAPARARPPAPDPLDTDGAGLPGPSSTSRLLLIAVVLAAVGGTVFFLTRSRAPAAEIDPAAAPAPATSQSSTSSSSSASAATSATSAPAASSPAASSEPPPPAAESASAVATTPAVISSAAAPASAPTPAASAISPDASYASTDAGLPAVDATRGIIGLPPAADSHRVFIDGRLAGVPPQPIVVGCGRHVVKVGSQGREQTVVVPCGGFVSVAYP